MNLKRIFGALLTLLGITGLIYAAVLFTNVTSKTHDVLTVIMFSGVGLIFFIAGISLIRTTKDES
jgi:uncharacterized membrane protein